MILICQHCHTEFTHNSPKALFCLKTEDCIEARRLHLKTRDSRNWQIYAQTHTRKPSRKGKSLRHCRHCDVDFWGRENQVNCRRAPECIRASWVYYQAMRRQRNGEYRKERSRRDVAKSLVVTKKKTCTLCHKRPVARGNYFFCGKCFSGVSNHYMPPQATQYDPYRGQPRA